MNDQSATMRLPIHPSLLDGESLSGWCWRTYIANGHEVPSAVRSALRFMRSPRTLERRSTLSLLVGLEQLKPLHVRECSLLEAWSKRLSPKWYAWSDRPRFCGQCMAEKECHLVYWDLPLVSACAVHGCHLTSHCHACERHLSWSTIQSGWECRCGERIAMGPAEQAPLSAIRLSRVLCRASDALVPQPIKEASSDSNLTSAAYRTRDVYETLGWLLKVRRVLTDPMLNFTPKDWPLRATPGARMVPGSWEVSLLTRFPHSVNRRARQTLSWFFQSKNSTLVELRSIRRWSDVKRLMDDLNTSGNPLNGEILNAIESVLREHHAQIPGLETTFFNPRLKKADRHKRIEEMYAWWPRGDASSSGEGGEEPPKPYQVLGGKISALLGYRKEVTADILNLIFDATRRRSAEADREKGASKRPRVRA